jgi:hypothetical protein
MISMTRKISEFPCPSENGIIFMNVHDFLLQPVKCPMALSVSKGMLTPKMSMRQYASFSFLVVFLLAAQDKRVATLVWSK